MSWNAFSQNLTLPAKTENFNLQLLGLQLPEPLKITHNGTIMFAWDKEGYATILKIFTGYNLWADNHILVLDLEKVYKARIDNCNKRLKIKDDAISLIEEDREYAYKLFERERKDIAKINKKNTIKLVLVSGSTAIVGIAAGILIGLLAGH